jgi:heme-degrading monooxygenase HmoA
MFARASTMIGSPAKADEATSVLAGQVAPQMQQIEGFSGIIGLVDRETGKSLVITLWETQEALEASEEIANKLRATAATELGSVETPTIDRYEVVLQDVRSPVHA